MVCSKTSGSYHKPTNPQTTNGYGLLVCGFVVTVTSLEHTLYGFLSMGCGRAHTTNPQTHKPPMGMVCGFVGLWVHGFNTDHKLANSQTRIPYPLVDCGFVGMLGDRKLTNLWFVGL